MPQQTLQHTAVRDLLDQPPGWLLRSGIGMLFIGTLLLLGLAALIRYPEHLEAPCMLQTEVPPLPVRIGTGAYLDTLYIANNQTVQTGQRLAVLRYAGNWRDLDRLRSWLSGALMNDQQNLAPPPAPVRLELGPLQAVYNQVVLAQNALNDYTKFNGLNTEMKRRRREIGSVQKLLRGQERDRSAFQRTLALQDSQQRRDSLLREEGLLSDQEYERSQQTTIGLQRQRQGVLTGTVQNEVRINQLKREMAELERKHRLELNRLRHDVKRTLLELDAALEATIQEIFVVSPGEGILSWQEGLTTRTLLDAGEPLGFIVPEHHDQTVVVRATLPGGASGRAVEGQAFFVALDGYPDREFGQLPGRITYLDRLALPDREGLYGIPLRGELTTDFVSTYQRRIPFRQNATGTLRIITEDRSLLSRLFLPFLDLFKNN